MNDPAVSVLIPVFNAEGTIRETIESVLNQTFSDFELIIIDDCSSDNSVTLIQTFNDQRIKLFRNEINLKIPKTLNKGLSLCKANLIARMDADDLMHPDRLMHQVEFLKSNPETGLCGTWFRWMSSGNTVKLPLSHDEIMVAMFFKNPIAHPTVMFRRTLVESGDFQYNTQLDSAQDYELWARLIRKTRFANIPSSLLLYRESETQISRRAKDHQKDNANRVREALIRELLPGALETSIDLYNKVVNKTVLETPADYNTLGSLLLDIIKSNHQRQILNQSLLKQSVYDLWYNICLRAIKSGKAPFSMVFQRELAENILWRPSRWIKLFVSAFINRKKS